MIYYGFDVNVKAVQGLFTTEKQTRCTQPKGLISGRTYFLVGAMSLDQLIDRVKGGFYSRYHIQWKTPQLEKGYARILLHTDLDSDASKQLFINLYEEVIQFFSEEKELLSLNLKHINL